MGGGNVRTFQFGFKSDISNEHFIKTFVCVSAYLKHNSLNISQSKKCFEQKSCRRIKDPFMLATLSMGTVAFKTVMLSSHNSRIFWLMLPDIVFDPCLSAPLFYTIYKGSWKKCIILYIFSCLSCHWFLAIICFPGLKGSVRFSDNTPIVIPPVVKKKKVVPRKDVCKYHEKYTFFHAVACQVSGTIFIP